MCYLSRRLIIGLFTAVIFGGLAQAAPATKSTVALVTGNDYRPFTDESLPEGGMVTALVRTVYAHLGQKVRIDFLPWKRGYKDARDGHYTAAFPYVKTEKRTAAFHYSKPIFTLRQKPLVAADSDIKAQTVADLKGMRYCLPHGYAPSPEIAAMTESGDLVRSKPERMTLCLLMLDKGRIDFIPTNELLGATTARAVFGNLDKVRSLDLTIRATTLHMIFPRVREDSEDSVDRFNKGLKAIRANRMHHKIIERFRRNEGL